MRPRFCDQSATAVLTAPNAAASSWITKTSTMSFPLLLVAAGPGYVVEGKSRQFIKYTLQIC
jgi:hypothetical protein